MTVKNIDHFSDLSQEMQDQLLQYIEEHFSKKNGYNHDGLSTAGGLKQHFTSTIASKTEHVTKQCFMEAMVKYGFKAKVLDESKYGDSRDWVFNVYIRKSSFPKP